MNKRNKTITSYFILFSLILILGAAVMKATNSGGFGYAYTNNRDYVRPVISLNKNTYISKGDGTSTNPFIVKY